MKYADIFHGPQPVGATWPLGPDAIESIDRGCRRAFRSLVGRETTLSSGNIRAVARFNAGLAPHELVPYLLAYEAEPRRVS